jgi:hypothetical protein
MHENNSPSIGSFIDILPKLRKCESMRAKDGSRLIAEVFEIIKK